MMRHLRELIAHRLTRTVVVFQFGSAGAMLVQAVANIFLARALGPSEFGRYALAVSVASVGSVLLGAGVSDAMAPVLTRAHHRGDDRGVRDALLFLGKFVLATATVALLLGLLMPSITERLYHDRMLGWFGLAMLASSALSTLLLTPTQLVLQVAGKIRRLSMLVFTDQVVRSIVLVSLALGGLGALGATYGNLYGSILMMGISLYFWLRIRHAWPIVPTVRDLWHEFPHDGRQHVASTLWVLADRNISMLYGMAPIAVAGLFLSTRDVSFFKIALGWTTLALSVITPISVLLNTELARIQVQQPHRLRAQFVRITLAAVAVSTCVTLGAALIARPIFGLLYGPEYDGAVALVYWMIPFGMLFGLGIALGPMWRAINRVKVSIIINLCVLSLGGILGAAALHSWGPVGAVALVTLWYGTSHTVSFLWLLRALRPSATLNGTL